ncbi:hypothetical protein L596_002859 [Steinernema carpocapsae]|uniref:Uncharacterized protein n=1 Tax=Steinernema carpocapsae TaxID=34508 RepID=A0A4U8UQX3_STECR|nr:hypothetical protein L596_002859 [Steinernema carpocapsae]
MRCSAVSPSVSSRKTKHVRQAVGRPARYDPRRTEAFLIATIYSAPPRLSLTHTAAGSLGAHQRQPRIKHAFSRLERYQCSDAWRTILVQALHRPVMWCLIGSEFCARSVPF